MSEGKKTNRKTILVTGFGPFKGHPTNASWEAVKELRNLDVENELNVALVTAEIPVAYQSVSTIIPQLWSDYDPMLVIHVGVSSSAKSLTIESRAHRYGYVKLDVEKKCPLQLKTNEVAAEDDNISIETEIDVDKICDSINTCASSQCEAIVSKDAGRYLCEYIYHQSLSINPKKTIFVHVPDLAIYSASKTAQGIYQAIKFAVESIEIS